MVNGKKESKVYIIGAGISGLVAAINLEQLGYSPILLESTDRVGGRVKTDIVDRYQLDHGFQVLLESYPLAKKYLDYEALALQPLSPGAAVFSQGKGYLFGDPLRESMYFKSTLLSSLGTLMDKWKIYTLRNQLKSKRLEQIFSDKEKTTYAYLIEYGFTETMINNFFRPFFSGIFLEPHLKTSSRMFEFVYKMFGEGRAMIPKEGMQAIPDQLKSRLKQTTFQFSTTVAKVSNEKIYLSNGKENSFDFLIIATDPSKIMMNYHSSLEWKSCDNLYFTTPTKKIDGPVIGLNANPNGLVNNIFYPTSVETGQKGDNQLLSVTVVKSHSYRLEELQQLVTEELNTDFGITDVSFLKHYPITYALPNLKDLQYERDPSENLLTERIALAGDFNLNGSLNAAMIAGENASKIASHVLAESLMTTS